jgi:hypothetical protein
VRERVEWAEKWAEKWAEVVSLRIRERHQVL